MYFKLIFTLFFLSHSVFTMDLSEIVHKDELDPRDQIVSEIWVSFNNANDSLREFKLVKKTDHMPSQEDVENNLASFLLNLSFA